jgi:hypothetical protein
MKQRVLVALLTVLVFAAGFAARVWTERAQPLPAAPRLGGEFAPKISPPDGKKPASRSDLVTEIEKWKAQSEVYRAQVASLDAEFDRDFGSLLRADQRDLYLANQKKRAEKAAERDARFVSGPSLTDDDIDRLKQSPLNWMLYTIAISARADRLAKDYKLDSDQLPKTHELLARRRDKLIALVDATPPPSISLSALAPLVQKLGDPKKP